VYKNGTLYTACVILFILKIEIFNLLLTEIFGLLSEKLIMKFFTGIRDGADRVETRLRGWKFNTSLLDSQQLKVLHFFTRFHASSYIMGTVGSYLGGKAEGL
jgi:hypothetical protein